MVTQGWRVVADVVPASCGSPALGRALAGDCRHQGFESSRPHIYDCSGLTTLSDELQMIDTRMDCLFCGIEAERIVAMNDLAYAIRDAFPVTPLHTLIIPRRHVVDYFELSEREVLSCQLLLVALRERLMDEDKTIQGFNIGMNCGEAAGQTIFHCHIHLFPRRIGDVKYARGGVRHLIPNKGYY